MESIAFYDSVVRAGLDQIAGAAQFIYNPLKHATFEQYIADTLRVGTLGDVYILTWRSDIALPLQKLKGKVTIVKHGDNALEEYAYTITSTTTKNKLYKGFSEKLNSIIRHTPELALIFEKLDAKQSEAIEKFICTFCSLHLRSMHTQSTRQFVDADQAVRDTEDASHSYAYLCDFAQASRPEAFLDQLGKALEESFTE